MTGGERGARIVAAVETPYTRHPAEDVTTESLLADAFVRVLASAGLERSVVDGLGVASFTHTPDRAIDLAWKLGVRPRWLMDDGNGGASGIQLLQHALRAIEAGDATTIVLLSGDHFDRDSFRTLVDNYNRTTAEFLAGIPTGGPNVLFAMLTRQQMEAHGLEREDVPVVSGADALVVSAAGEGVTVRALRALHNHDGQEGDGLQTGVAEIRGDLWEDANAGPEDVDVVSVYDDYPAMALAQLADLGFVPDGDFGGFLRRRFEEEPLAVNTSGGQLSAGQAGAAGGMHGLVEAVTQLLGRAGERQVDDARLAVVTGYGMVLYRYGGCANAVVLERS